MSVASDQTIAKRTDSCLPSHTSFLTTTWFALQNYKRSSLWVCSTVANLLNYVNSLYYYFGFYFNPNMLQSYYKRYVNFIINYSLSWFAWFWNYKDFCYVKNFGTCFKQRQAYKRYVTFIIAPYRCCFENIAYNQVIF